MQHLIRLGRGAVAFALAWLVASAARAQVFYVLPPDTTQVFTYVEQMPALPAGGGNLALVKAVQRNLQLPPEVREGRTEGQVYVRAVVGASGVLRQLQVVRSLSPACDAAALAAVQRLPRLLPGRANGQPVAALLTLPVVFYSPRHVFSTQEVTRTAEFPGGEDALEKFVLEHRQLPPEVAARGLRGRVVVRFAVRANGTLGATEVTASLSPACDDEALRLVRLMPKWQPAHGFDDQPVASYQAVNIWFQPPAEALPNTPENQILPLAYADQPPTLPDGRPLAALPDLVQPLIDYPDGTAQGTVQVSFVVEPDGRVTRPKVTKSLGAAYDEAALAAVLKLPHLLPAQRGGRPVAVRATVPLEFALR